MRVCLDTVQISWPSAAPLGWMHVNWCLGGVWLSHSGVLMEPQWIREPQGRKGTGHWPNHSPSGYEDIKKASLKHPNSRLLLLLHRKYDCSYYMFANGSSLVEINSAAQGLASSGGLQMEAVCVCLWKSGCVHTARSDDGWTYSFLGSDRVRTAAFIVPAIGVQAS